MTPQQLEALVMETINQVRSGNGVEDDRIELKRDWPDMSKARQLAGAANRANGNPLIYVIGIDERTGLTLPLTATDTADWWSQMSSRFDAIAPDLLSHIHVPLGVGDAVTALLFSTDRVPYLVKSENGGSPEREVPMRDGTRTRSARRDELLRMLVPVSLVPKALLLEAELEATWFEARKPKPALCVLSCHVNVFLEHTSPASVLLPMHEMSATLIADDIELDMEVDFWRHSVAKEAAPPAFGVHVRHDGVVVTGPGTFRTDLSGEMADADRYLLQGIREWRLKISFGVAGASRAVLAEGRLSRGKTKPIHNPDTQIPLGRWNLSK